MKHSPTKDLSKKTTPIKHVYLTWKYVNSVTYCGGSCGGGGGGGDVTPDELFIWTDCVAFVAIVVVCAETVVLGAEVVAVLLVAACT